MPYDVRFTSRAEEFWRWAGAHLSADPVRSTVVASVAQRHIRHGDPEPWSDAHTGPYWYATVTDGRGEVVGVAMRTSPEVGYAPYVLPMPDAAARELGAAVRARSEGVDTVNGALPAARVVAEAFGTPVLEEQNRLWELGELVEPAPVPGRLRPVTTDAADLARAVSWFNRFGAAAAEQAGRAAPAGPGELVDEAGMRQRVDDGRVHFWEVEGRPVHVVGHNPPAHGVARIGPVYTPPGERGHGYAAAAVAAVARRLRADGARVCLFTDEANPVSNRLYARLGFEPVADMVQLVVQPPAG
jgi:RimJ/RimL family protein N-acetyltransferase